MTLKEKYKEAMEAYKQTVENWNTLIEKDASLPNIVWNKLLAEMEEAKRKADEAWAEYLHKEILA